MSVSVTQHKQFIGGEWVESASGETMEVLNPATGEPIAEVPRSTAEDVDRAVDAAKKAWSEWQWRTPRMSASSIRLGMAPSPADAACTSPKPSRISGGM